MPQKRHCEQIFIMSQRHVKHPFPPIIDKHSRVLILGSVPSVLSIEHNFYYMNPRNRFWELLSKLLDEDFVSVDTNARAELLLKHHIALHDSVEECDIEGSSDNKIKNAIPSDIPSFLATADIKQILCNGTAAYNYLVRFYPEYRSIAMKLPSTSPANASYTLPKLLNEWEIIKNYI